MHALIHSHVYFTRGDYQLPLWGQASYFSLLHSSQSQAAKCRNNITLTNQRTAKHAHLFSFIAVDKFNLTCSFAWGNRLNTSAACLVNWNNKVLSFKHYQQRSWNIRLFSFPWIRSMPCKVRTLSYVFNDFLNCLFMPALSTWSESPNNFFTLSFLCCNTPGQG